MDKISRRLRLGTMLLDHAIICLVAIPPIVIYHQVSGRDESIDPYLMMLFLSFYFCKDCIGGRSPAKRILKLCAVDAKTNTICSPYQALIRNFFILIWPAEVIVAYVNQGRRIGDIVAGTEVQYAKTVKPPGMDKGKVLICVFIAIAISYLLSQGLQYVDYR